MDVPVLFVFLVLLPFLLLLFVLLFLFLSPCCADYWVERYQSSPGDPTQEAQAARPYPLGQPKKGT
jgi:hypothetical protein